VLRSSPTRRSSDLVLLWDRLRDLKDRGVTLLLTTHYMDEAERLCDELVIMHEGAIIDRDTPRRLVDRHVGRWAAEIELTAAPDPKAVAAQLPSSLRRWEPVGRSLHLFAELGRGSGRDRGAG